MRLFLLHNPGAGRAHLGREDLMRLLARHGHEVVYYSSKDEEWLNALDGRFDLLVAAGGDGTVAKLGRAALGRDVPLAVLPLGTANNVSGVLGADGLSPEDAVASWRLAERRPFDVGRAAGARGERRFLEGVGTGLLAEAIHHASTGAKGPIKEAGGADERVAAARGAAHAVLDRLEPQHVGISLDGRSLSGDYLLVEALNCGRTGPDLWLAPAGVPGDGLFDLVLATETERPHLSELLRTGRLPSPGALPRHQARRVSIDRGSHPLRIDDDLEESDAGSIELTLEHAALTFLVPSS